MVLELQAFFPNGRGDDGDRRGQLAALLRREASGAGLGRDGHGGEHECKISNEKMENLS